MASLRGLVPDMRPWAEQLYAIGVSIAPDLMVTSVYRSRSEQARLYARYLAGQSGGIPAAPPGLSWHEWRLAFDLARPLVDPYQDEVLAFLGAVWKGWGGLWKPVDPVHFQA